MHIRQQRVVSSVTGRQLRKHIPPKWHQHAPGPSGMFSSMFPSLGCPLPRFPSVVMAVLAGRSMGRRMTCPAIVILRSAIISWSLLVPALCRISSLVMWSQYDTCSIRRRHFWLMTITPTLIHSWLTTAIRHGYELYECHLVTTATIHSGNTLHG